MSGATCATCRHFRPQDGSARGDCWRYPPREGDVSVTTADVCGEHAPTPVVGAVGLPELPDGWRWDLDALPDHTRAHSVTYDIAVLIDADGEVHADGAPIAVVEAVIAAHRARAGGAA